MQELEFAFCYGVWGIGMPDVETGCRCRKNDAHALTSEIAARKPATV